jgi:hypothetical protein
MPSSVALPRQLASTKTFTQFGTFGSCRLSHPDGSDYGLGDEFTRASVSGCNDCRSRCESTSACVAYECSTHQEYEHRCELWHSWPTHYSDSVLEEYADEVEWRLQHGYSCFALSNRPADPHSLPLPSSLPPPPPAVENTVGFIVPVTAGAAHTATRALPLPASHRPSIDNRMLTISLCVRMTPRLGPWLGFCSDLLLLPAARLRRYTWRPLAASARGGACATGAR